MKIRFAVDQRGSSHVTRCAGNKNLLGGHFNRKGNSRVELGLNAEDGVQGNITQWNVCKELRTRVLSA